MRDTTLGGLLVLGAAAGFGTIGIFGELAVATGLPLRTMLPLRFALATALIGCIAGLREWPLPASPRTWGVLLGLGVVYTAMTLLYFISLRFLTAGLATIVLYTYPAFVVGLSAVLLGESLTGRKLLALALTLGGVVLVVGTDTAGAEPLGVGLALGAAVCYALYTAGSRAAVPSTSPGGLTFGVLVGTTLSMSVYGVLDGGLALPAAPDEWAIVVGLAVVSTVIPHLMFYQGVARLEAGRVGVISTAEPVVTVMLGAVLLGETVTAFVLLGGGLVLGGVVLAQRGRADADDGDLTHAGSPGD